jgi:transposase
MKPISDEIRNKIVSLLRSGYSQRTTAKMVKLSHVTIKRVCDSMGLDIQKSRGGRPAKLTPYDKRNLVRTITSGKADTAVQLAQQLRNGTGVEVSANTVRRALK